MDELRLAILVSEPGSENLWFVNELNVRPLVYRTNALPSELTNPYRSTNSEATDVIPKY